ncbi:MAG TPA: hypothetical protein DCM86_10900, partial [Verrucomicrobiales bacterium]|nr:hypothetical protein [Verrucomicrobiales bacterium]
MNGQPHSPEQSPRLTANGSSGSLSWRRLAPWLSALIVLPALLAAALHFSSLTKFVELAQNAQPQWLLPVLAAQAATYVFGALAWHQVLLSAGQPRPFPTLFRLSIAKLYTDQA